MKKIIYKTRNAVAIGVVFAASAVITPSASASELVYYPVNPNFGGNPLNGPMLLNSAITTSKHRAPDDGDINGRLGFEEQTPLDQLNETLERLVIGRMASAASLSILDPVTGAFRPGLLETQNFTITVTDIGDGQLAITTYDKTTGATTVVELN